MSQGRPLLTFPGQMFISTDNPPKVPATLHVLSLAHVNKRKILKKQQKDFTLFASFQFYRHFSTLFALLQ